jgi:4-amino-4-deoxy-L-arabinose transferase-like glycosyltransferase
METARNVLDEGVWSSDPAPNPLPDNFRAPIYPLLLIGFMKLGWSFSFLFVLQALAVAMAAGLTYWYGRSLFSERVGLIAGLVLAVDPILASRAVSKALMTEAFALPLLLIGFGSLALFVKRSDGKHLLVSTVALGLGANLKPQFVFFLLLSYVAVFLVKRVSARTVLASFGISGLLLLPWLSYNFIGLRVPQFSSVSETNLFDIGYRFQHWRTKSEDPYFNESYIIAGSALVGAENSMQLFEPVKAKRLAHIGREWIMSAPLPFLWFHTTRVPRTFYHDTTIDTLYEDFGWFPSLRNGDSTVLAKHIVFFRWPQALREIREHPATLLALSVQIVVLLMSLLALLNYVIRRAVTGERSAVALLWLALLLAYGFLVSPMGLHRYRVPIEPMLLLLAIDSVFVLAEWKKTRV